MTLSDLPDQADSDSRGLAYALALAKQDRLRATSRMIKVPALRSTQKLAGHYRGWNFCFRLVKFRLEGLIASSYCVYRGKCVVRGLGSESRAPLMSAVV